MYLAFVLIVVFFWGLIKPLPGIFGHGKGVLKTPGGNLMVTAASMFGLAFLIISSAPQVGLARAGVLLLLTSLLLLLFGGAWSLYDHISSSISETTERKRQEAAQEAERKRQKADQEQALQNKIAEGLAAFVKVTGRDDISGYRITNRHGWVRCQTERKSKAIEELKRLAVLEEGNALINLSSHLLDETVVEEAPSGRSYNRHLKKKEWEAEVVRVERHGSQSSRETATTDGKSTAHSDSASQVRPAEGAIAVIDGSNIMHWPDNVPRLENLAAVVADMKKEGYMPHVFFDANFRYKIGREDIDQAALAREVGVPEQHLTVVPGGTSADPYILNFARSSGGFVVSDDRFRTHGDRTTGLRLVIPMMIGDQRCYNL